MEGVKLHSRTVFVRQVLDMTSDRLWNKFLVSLANVVLPGLRLLTGKPEPHESV